MHWQIRLRTAAFAAWDSHLEPVCNLNANEAAFRRQLMTFLFELYKRNLRCAIQINILASTLCSTQASTKKALKTVLLREKEAVSEFQICSQNTITFNSIRTLPEVLFNTICTLKIFATQTTAKSFVVWVHKLMKFQCRWRVETLWALIANIRLHTFMSPNVFLKVIFATEFLLANLTGEPSSFIVRLQQMWLKCISASETFWTMCTRVWLCITVNTGMLLHLISCLEQFSTVRTVIRFPVAVYRAFVSLQSARLSEILVTQWALVRLIYIYIYIYKLRWNLHINIYASLIAPIHGVRRSAS